MATDAQLIQALKDGGNVIPEITLEESRLAGLETAVLAAVLEQETEGGKNEYGHDPTIFVGRGLVTRDNYLSYKAQRGPDGKGGMQGVGPMQLTWFTYQDAADKLGGCWIPKWNVRIGAQLLAADIRASGLYAALKAYNGSDAYAHQVMDRVTAWRARLGAVPSSGMRVLHVTTPLMSGPDVVAAQQLLAHDGFDPGTIDGQWGSQCGAAAVRAKWAYGYPDKLCTATFGAYLHAYLVGGKLPTAYALRRKLRLAAYGKALTAADAFYLKALSQLGVKESPAGTNDVLYSRWYTGESGAGWSASNPGPPWCAMLVSWVCAQLKLKFRYAYCPYVVADARASRNGLSVVSGPTSGKLVFALFDWPGESPGTSDHIGTAIPEADLGRLRPELLAKARAAYGSLASGEFWSVEGNTGVGNDSNGGEVMLRKRARSTVQAFVQIKV